MLAAALIVKDEEHYLPECLEHLNALRPLLSEICVYDTGSTDRTIEIAEAGGARVERGYWDDDFGRAKNAAVAMCRAKWVMIVDADERVVADKSALGQLLRNSLTVDAFGLDAIRIQLVSLEDHSNESYSLPLLRIYRPGRCHYVGRIHEQVALRQPTREMRILEAPASLVKWLHVGYVKAAMPGKGARNLALAQDAITSSGDDGAVLAKRLLDRARSHMVMGQARHAIGDYFACWRLKTDAGDRLWAGQDLAQLLNNLGLYDDAAVIARELQQDGRQPQYADWMLARARRGQGRTREALDFFRKVDDPRNAAGINRGTADVIEGRMLCAADSGEFDEALACCVRLMAGHGRVEGRGSLLMRLWGDRNPTDLASLLVETGPGRIAALEAELQSSGPAGEAVACALRDVKARTSAFRPAEAILDQSRHG